MAVLPDGFEFDSVELSVTGRRKYQSDEPCVAVLPDGFEFASVELSITPTVHA